MDTNLETMYDGSCHLCRLRIFPHEAGGKVRIEPGQSVEGGKKIHIGFNAYNDNAIVPYGPPLKPILYSISNIKDEYYKKRAYFKMFETKLFALRIQKSLLTRQLALDIDGD